MTKILIVEDEQAISKLIEMNLKDSGYHCTCAYDGNELLEYIKPTKTPTIFLTAKVAVNDRVKGLQLGAEDYIVKPFAIVELLARIEVVLRRYNKDKQEYLFDEFKIDLLQRTIEKNGERIELTPKEFDLMVLFVQNKNIALTRERIFEVIWETEFSGDTRTVDLHVVRLRKKLGLEARLNAVYKIGYRLEAAK